MVKVTWHSDRIGDGATTGPLQRIEETRIVVGDFAVRFEIMRGIEALEKVDSPSPR